MNEQDFIRSIAKFWRYSDGISVGELFSNPVSIRPSDEFRSAALTPGTQYEELYLTGMRNSDYNILLRDYSFFQFGRTGENLRSAFYPNPFFGASVEAMQALGEKHELLHEGLISMETFLHEVSEVSVAERPPLIRYEYDPSSYLEHKHPASHFHIGHHGENRWPVERMISPEAFGLLVLKLYYSVSWVGSKEQVYGDKTASIDEIFRAAKQGCNLLPVDEFSLEERQHFFLG